MLWTILPKETFVRLSALLLDAYISIILFKSGYLGLLPVFENLGIPLGQDMIVNYSKIDNEQILNLKRHSLESAKIARKKKTKS